MNTKKSFNITKIEVNGETNPICAEKEMQFSWNLESDVQGLSQSAFEIGIASTEEKAKQGDFDVFSSGRIASAKPYYDYDGTALQDKTQYYFVASVWCEEEEVKSEVHCFETEPNAEEFEAKWITYTKRERDKTDVTIPLFAKDFSLSAKVKKARAYVSGLGLYEMTINGEKVSENYFEPGESDYDETIFYMTYDVTDLLKQGENTVGMMLGGANYRMVDTTNASAEYQRYQKLSSVCGVLKCMVQLEIELEDGTQIVIASDDSWKWSTGGIRFSSWYGGEDYDARLEQEGWDSPGFDRSGWETAVLAAKPKGTLKSRCYPPLVAIEQWKAVAVLETGNAGEYIIDFGKNFAGIFQASIRGTKGSEVRFYPGERLNKDGTLDQSTSTHSSHLPLYDSYIFGEKEEGIYAPTFNYHGFRYLRVTGLSYQPNTEDFTGIFISTASEKVSTFKTNDETLNKLHEIILRSANSNMYNTLTDCPHIEKLGWLEVPNLMYESLAYNFDINNLMRKIARDTTDNQMQNYKNGQPVGQVTTTAPEYAWFGGEFREDPTWGGAAIMVPYQSYLYYGDLQLLQEQYPTMVRYIEYLKNNKSNGNLLQHGLGDWGNSFDPSTPVELAVSCTYYCLADTMAKSAEILGKGEDAETYRTLAEDIKKAINLNYFNRKTKSYGKSQACNAMPLYYGIVEEEYKEAVFENLITQIRKDNSHLTTGEIALKPLFHVLADNGRSDIVYDMMSADSMPSYYYFVKQGSTSLPEFWDMDRSQNHIMMGHIESWLFEYLAGIKNTGIGFDTLEISPYFTDKLDYVDASTEGVNGTIRSYWRRENGQITLIVEIPVNSVAEIVLSTAEGERRMTCGSGTYEFSFEERPSKAGLVTRIETIEAYGYDNIICNKDLLLEQMQCAKEMLDKEVSAEEIAQMEEKLDSVYSTVLFKDFYIGRSVFSNNSLNGWGWNLEYINDGLRKNNNYKGYSSNPFNTNKPEKSPYIGYDFGREQKIDSVKLTPRSDVKQGYPKGFIFQYSNDGVTFHDLLVVQDTNNKAYAEQVYTFPEVSAKMVRLVATDLGIKGSDGSYYLQLEEMETYYSRATEE